MYREELNYFLVNFKTILPHTETFKSGKMGEHFPVRKKSGNLEHTGKVWGFPHKILEKSIFT